MSTTPSTSESERQKDLSDRLDVMAAEQQERLARHRADQLHVPYISLVTFPIDPDILEVIPRDQAQAAGAVLFYRHGQDIRLGVVNPAVTTVPKVVQQLQETFGVEPQIYVISHRSLQAALARYRRRAQAEVRPQGEMQVSKQETDNFAETLASLEDLGRRITSIPPTELLSAIVIGAVKMDASDIHVEPKEKEARLRFRIDGVLQDITAFARDGWSLLLSRIKVLSGLKLNIHDVPQDGSFVLRIEDAVYDMRVSILPGGYGENIVVRLLNRAAEALAVTDLGMKPRDYAVVQNELKRSNGMILVTGPTGSGKTTTLASFIREVNNPEIKIITLEDPIEYRLPGVEQTQVDEDAGYTFARGLRSILRQDPDMILVGEMRDTETAATAVHAALTGHLVFTTLHTNDAPGAVPRLVDMGVKPFVLAPALNMVIAQRLVRVVCNDCAIQYRPDAALRQRVLETMSTVRSDIFDPAVLRNPNLRFKKAKGCKRCGPSGYKGRVGVFEIFTVTGAMEELVLRGADSGRILDAALKQGMTTIAQDAYLKVIAGITTIEEVERISEE